MRQNVLTTKGIQQSLYHFSAINRRDALNSINEYHDLFRQKIRNKEYDPQASIRILEEIVSKGLVPKTYTLNLALGVARTDPNTCLEIYYGYAPKHNIKPNASTLSAVLSSLVADGSANLLDKALSAFEFERARLSQEDQGSLAAVLIRGCGRGLYQNKGLDEVKCKQIISKAKDLYNFFGHGDKSGKVDKKSPPQPSRKQLKNAADIGNAMIYTLAQANMGMEAKQVFLQMLHADPPIQPNSFSCVGLIKTLVEIKEVDSALTIYQIIKSHKLEIRSWHLIYSRLVRGVISAGHSINLVKSLLNDMKLCGLKADQDLLRYLIVACGNLGEKSQALQFFEQIEKPTVKEYGSLLSVLAQYGQFSEVENLLKRMKQHHIAPNEVMFLSIMQGSDVLKAEQALKLLEKEGQTLTVPIAAAYMATLLKELREKEALAFFKDYLKSSNQMPDEGLYSLALQASSALGNTEEMYSLWEDAKMRGISSTLGMYKTIMSGYARAKMPVQCEEVYQRMIHHENLTPDLQVHNIRVHAYSNAGMLDDAMNVVKEATKEGFSVDQVTMRSLIKACEDSNMMISELLQEIQAIAAGNKDISVSDPEIAGLETTMRTPDKTVDKLELSKEIHSLESNYIIDLHQKGVAEAKATVLLWIGEMQQDFQHHKSQNKVLPDLTIITGVGKRSTVPGISVVREGIVGLLEEKELAFQTSERNPGRIIVRAKSLEQYFNKASKSRLKLAFTKYATLRYVMLPVALASFIVIPKLVSHL